MKSIYEENGHGIARNGLMFSPPIPAGATVSWKRMRQPVVLDGGARKGTHVLAVWNRLDEMDLQPGALRETPRGPCVPFYADAKSIRNLIESDVPAPLWIDADMEPATALAECMIAAQADAKAPRLGDTFCTHGNAGAWLRAAVWTYRSATGHWPILHINVARVLREAQFPAELLRGESDRLFSLAKKALAEKHLTSTTPRRPLERGRL
jgi:hypothetical protein